MNVRTLCLAILNAGESTGYEIRKLSTDGIYSHFVDASYGSIYPALTRLEQDGMVTSREESQAGKPSRKVYSVTDIGRMEFLQALTKPVQRDIFKSEFMLVALYAELMEPKVLTAAIDAQLEYLTGELATIESAQDEFEHDSANWIADFGRTCLTQSIAYITENRAALESKAGARLAEIAPSIAAE